MTLSDSLAASSTDTLMTLATALYAYDPSLCIEIVDAVHPRDDVSTPQPASMARAHGERLTLPAFGARYGLGNGLRTHPRVGAMNCGPGATAAYGEEGRSARHWVLTLQWQIDRHVPLGTLQPGTLIAVLTMDQRPDAQPVFRVYTAELVADEGAPGPHNARDQERSDR